MDNEEDLHDHSVTVTHFINPHLFWYRKIGGPDDNFHVLTLLEQNLQELYKNKPSTGTRCRPAVGDKVAVNYVVWNKFIRAEVLQKAEFQQEEYIVWAIDYGFPLLTKKEHVRILPAALVTPIGQIHCGGLFDIQPAELEYDHVECNLVMMKQDQWLQKACDMLEKLLADAASIIFVDQFQSEDDHHWGDLIIVNHKGNKFNARTYLQSAKYAMDVDTKLFPLICTNLKTTNIARWLSNSRKTKLKFNSIKHNIAEHSQQMNSAIIDECAKRKVQDWCERNAREEADDYILESGAESAHDQSLDDITFDDSVSVIHHKKEMEQIAAKSFHRQRTLPECEDQRNYIGKAGALTKLKQQKYASKQNLPPQVHSKAFNMDSKDIHLTSDADFKMKSSDAFMFPSEQPAATATVISSASSSTNVSSRMQKLADMRAQHARNAKQIHQQQQQQNACSGTSIVSDLDASTISSRKDKLAELRKKHARAEFEKMASTPADIFIGSRNVIVSPPSLLSDNSYSLIGMRPKYTANGSTLSTESHSTTTHPYQKLQQSTTANEDSNLDRTQDNVSGTISNPRAKQLSEIRRRLLPPPSNTTVDDIFKATTAKTLESQFGITSSKMKEQNPIDILETFDFKLKPKISTNDEKKAPIEIPRLPPMQRTKENKRESEAGYEGLTLVPAGYDITRLKTYRDEENHWHRKKSTRHERISHDINTVSSSEELLINNSHDQSSSSSDFFQIKPPVIKQKQASSTHSKRLTRPPSSVLRYETFVGSSGEHDEINILDRSVPSITDRNILTKPLKCSQQLEISSSRRNTTTATTDRFNDANYLSEISTSTGTTLSVNSQKQLIRKRHQLKSPTSQISKIDEILKQHCLEKERGNVNILDLKKIATSPQNSYASKRVGNSTAASSDSVNDCQKYGSEYGATNVAIKNRNIDMPKSKSSDQFPSEKHIKNISNYTTLKEVKHTHHLPIVEGEITIQTKFIDHLVLAHSSIPLTPIENVAEASFLPEIHEEMGHMRVNKVYRIQVYSWSHVLRGNSLFVVNPTRTGKTWSYLPALCSLVCCRFGRLKPSYGPVAIILVASSRHVESTYGYCRRLMSGLKAEAPNCVPSYGMRNFIDTKVQLLNGCGILVTTPSSLLRLLKDNDNEPLFDSERLQHIAIDDMDIMLSRSHEDFESAVRIVFKLSKKSKFKTLQPQLVVTSRDWDGVMIRLMRKSNQPLLLIGDFLEAAVYGRATLSVKLKSSQEKNDTILRFIKKQSQSLQGDLEYKRILIMCNGDEDVATVMQFLTECGYPCLAYYNQSTDSERATVDEWKNKVSSQILICTDARFPELQIQNVQNLIHYSMPTSWTQFTTRFSALAKSYDNFVCKNFEQPPIVAAPTTMLNEIPAHSMILLDEGNSLQLPRLVDFMRKHNQVVHPDILTVSKRVLVMREESRICKGALLCSQLMEFGECDDTRCDNRHELTRFDVIGKNDDIPCEGEIRIHILKVFSPTHYAARLLQHKPRNSTKWNEIRRSGETLTFSVQLDLHYRNEDNLSLHWPPYINDLCMYKYADNFRRALILDAPTLTGKHTNVVQANLKVTLKLIDDGTVISAVKCSEIFVCDDKFKDFPVQAIDIRLMHVVPYDNERSWDSKTTKQVQKWIMEDIKPSHVVQVGITFSLAQTVWVKNLVVMEMLSTLGTYRPYVNLKLSLIQKNFAMIYNGERKHVREIAEEYGLLKAAFSDLSTDGTPADTSLEDYESCHNDSVDLMKFSSSNGDGVTNSSMESARNYLPADEVDEPKHKERNHVEDMEPSQDKQASMMTLKSSCGTEENWDELLCDDPAEGARRGEVFLPLTTTNNEKEITAASSHPKEESWSQLSLNEVTKVEIGDEGENGNWENIFVQIIDKKHMAMFDDLTELIKKHVTNLKAAANKEEQQRIYDFEPLHNCIVKYGDIYLRAKVHGVFGANVKERLYRFFLCDYACFTNAKSHELYNDFFFETSTEIVNFIPYQSVHCTLAGIEWDRFTKRYQVTQQYLYACAMEERTAEENKSLSLFNLPIRSYKILLFECEKENEFNMAKMFNRTLVDNGVTKTDEATKHYLDYNLNIEGCGREENTPTIAEEEVNTSSSESDVYTFEQLIACIEKSYALDEVDNNLLGETKTHVLKEVEETEKVRKATEVTEQPVVAKTSKNKFKGDDQENYSKSKKPLIISELDDDYDDHCTTDDSDNKKSSISITSSNDNSYIVTPPPVLKALYKRPTTTWYETDCVIVISIYAPDITDYTLEVSQRAVLFATHIQEDEYVVFLNLLGSVDPQHVSHEIKGLNVVVRLVKNVFVTWPRLLQESTKYSWLKFNYNALDSTELEYIMPQQRLQSILENTPRINESNIYDDLDSEDSEHDRFQTFNHIENNDDHYDPFS